MKEISLILAIVFGAWFAVSLPLALWENSVWEWFIVTTGSMLLSFGVSFVVAACIEVAGRLYNGTHSLLDSLATTDRMRHSENPYKSPSSF